MKRKLVTLATISIIFLLIGTVYAAWYTMNSNPNFSSTANWEADTWMEGTGSHSYSISGGEAYTRLTISGINDWGNTEYEQGTDPWATYGSGFTSVSADITQRLVTNSKVSERSVNWLFGLEQVYVEFWLHCEGGDGSHGYEWAEAMVIFDANSGLFMSPNAGQNGYWSKTAYDEWYFVGYRHWNIGSSYTYKETNLNSIYGLLESQFGCDLDEWTVSCICVGVEGTSATVAAYWDYVFFDIAM